MAGTETSKRDGANTRVDTLAVGALVSATILERAERDHAYGTDDSPLPVESLVATLALREDGGRRCLMESTARSDAACVCDAAAVKLARGVFQRRLDALERET